MAVVIKNNEDGTTASVTADNQLRVRSEARSLQHTISFRYENTYQVEGEATLANGTVTCLHLKNDDTDKVMVISYVRVQMIDPGAGTAPPNAGTYFELGCDRTVASGGSAVTPINTNRASGKTASVTATDSAPTMAGTFAPLDKWYVLSDGALNTFNKEGSIILGLNDTFEVRATHDNAAGTAYARVTFMMMDPV